MGWLDGGPGVCKVKPEAKDDEVVGALVRPWVVAECLHVAVSQAPPPPTPLKRLSSEPPEHVETLSYAAVATSHRVATPPSSKRPNG